jgi:hypothetical protein
MRKAPADRDTQTRVTLISDFGRAFNPQADPRNVAMIRSRHALWTELAHLHGWDLTVYDTASLDALPGVRGSVSWIDLPMLPRATYGAVFARVAAAGAVCVLDPPVDVERVLGLDRFYPVLLRAGVPTPRTAFLPVDDALAAMIESPAAVRRLLTEQIYGALFDAGIDPHDGVFIRGFYSSAKSANPELYFGSNQADIEATVFEVIRRLRVALDVGGLALREHLDLERIELSTLHGDRDAIRVPFEVRLTVLGGRLLMASYHGPFEALADEARETLASELTTRAEAVQKAVRALALAPALLTADLPANYVADVAFVRGGEPVMLELNPLYAAGYNVPAAHALLVAALGADLARCAGYAGLGWAEVLDSAAASPGGASSRARPCGCSGRPAILPCRSSRQHARRRALRSEARSVDDELLWWGGRCPVHSPLGPCGARPRCQAGRQPLVIVTRGGCPRPRSRRASAPGRARLPVGAPGLCGSACLEKLHRSVIRPLELDEGGVRPTLIGVMDLHPTAPGILHILLGARPGEPELPEEPWRGVGRLPRPGWRMGSRLRLGRRPTSFRTAAISRWRALRSLRLLLPVPTLLLPRGAEPLLHVPSGLAEKPGAPLLRAFSRPWVLVQAHHAPPQDLIRERRQRDDLGQLLSNRVVMLLQTGAFTFVEARRHLREALLELPPPGHTRGRIVGVGDAAGPDAP